MSDLGFLVVSRFDYGEIECREAAPGFKVYSTAGVDGTLPTTRAVPAKVLASRQKGKKNPAYTQFDTVWGYRTAFSNQWCASAAWSSVIISMGSPDGKDHIQFSVCHTNSLWFTRFFKGCRLRMGQDVRQNLALEGAVVKALLDLIEQELNDDPDKEEFRWLVTVGAYIAVMYCHVIARKRGVYAGSTCAVKVGEEGERQHMFPVVSVTHLGINVREWIAALIIVQEKEGRVNGPAFCDTEGVDAKFRDLVVTTLQSRRSDLIRTETDVAAEISIVRSLRRGAQSMAYVHNVSKSKRSGQKEEIPIALCELDTSMLMLSY
eukprot:scaffold72694_cov62-Attheya_sp.AAC.1